MKGYYLNNISIKEEELTVGKLKLAFPNLEPSQLMDISDRLIESQEKLSRESIFTILDWIDQTARRWLDPKDFIREEAESIIPLVSGISKEMLHFVLDDLFKNLRRPLLLQFLEEELGDPRCLDQFCPKKKGVGFSRAFGPRLIAHILPGNISGISIISLVCGLLVKSANLVRCPRTEMLLPVLFARSLQEVWPEMAQSLGIVTWDKGKEAITEAAFQKADLAIVYGSDQTIERLRKVIPPTIKTVFHGHKLSLGIIARESIRFDLAEKAAVDITLNDQKGCLSPHLYYVELHGESTPLLFAQWLSQALYAISRRLPKGETPPGLAAQIQQLRGSLPLKGGTVFSSPKGVEWTVLYDTNSEFSISPLSRTVWVKPVRNLDDVPAYIEPLRGSLQAIGFALPEGRQAALISRIAGVGGCRVCPIGEMQTPPITWHHDGEFRLLPLLRFVDWENP